MNLSSSQKKTLRRIAHHLDAVVQVGDKNITENVVAETDRALRDHELIKVRISSGERDDRAALGEKLASACDADIVQRIGKVAVLFRANPKANPKLSNLHRHAGGT
ncbi:MAG: ribosome assembly RNA-binding protein YhbY [Pseudomonadales bacterium]|jgi:RNA-binding protein|nr:ribosome assembly RNA-binding protein YhbY [Pseudomonadales bacterium]